VKSKFDETGAVYMAKYQLACWVMKEIIIHSKVINEGRNEIKLLTILSKGRALKVRSKYNQYVHGSEGVVSGLISGISVWKPLRVLCRKYMKY
jgi:hypothetical protein